MKYLKNYQTFETEKFLEGKQLVFLKGKYVDNANFKGLSLTVLILQDAKGENTGEEFTVKIPNGQETFLNSLKPLTQVKITNVSKVSIYGDYQNQLSMHANVSVIGK